MENFGNSHLKELISILKTNCARITDDECGQLNCNECRAMAIYEAGWRKQIEAEWIPTDWIPVEQFVPDWRVNMIHYYACSNCKTLDYTNDKKYCPNCGAKMEGAE